MAEDRIDVDDGTVGMDTITSVGTATAIEPDIISEIVGDGTEAEIGPKLSSLEILADEFDGFADKLEQARISGKPLGPVSGFETIDRQLAGAFQQGLHVLTGNTGAGKTAFASQLAAQCGCPALFVSCEMSGLELLRRTAARVNRVPLHEFKDPKVSPPANVLKAKIRNAAQAVRTCTLRMDFRHLLPPTTLSKELRV